MKISISGIAGAGKTSISKMLAEKLGYNWHSIGKLARELAMEKGMHMYEFSKLAEDNKEIDFELDERQRSLNSKDNFVMDSRLGFHFIPSSYKIFLKVDMEEAARRVFNDKRGEERYGSLEETIEIMRKRLDSEKKRYKGCYGINFIDEGQFDLIIDTTKRNKKEVVRKILMNLYGK